MGLPLKTLKQLQWGQIESDEDGTWVRLRPGARRLPLPGEVWRAIRAYLAAAGRLAGIRPGDYVFAPLAAAVKAGENDTAQDWARERCLSNDQILASLKLYGRLVEIPERKLTLRALHRTAVRLRLDQGPPLEELQTFLDSREKPAAARYRLGKLPQLPETGPAAEIVAQVPDRKTFPARPWSHPRVFRPQPAGAGGARRAGGGHPGG
jgi:integrase